MNEPRDVRGHDSSLKTGGWRNFERVYAKLRPPLTPAPSDVRTFRQCVEGKGRVLLLGVTPELAALAPDLTAVDNSPRMLANVWPGDRDGRRAILADWTDLPFSSGTFDAVIGDAPLNAAPEQIPEVLAEVRRVLSPCGQAGLRLFCSPERAETLESIRDDVAGGWTGNLHALKWRIAMVLAASRPSAIVPVRDILAAFDRTFPDRRQLAAATGWPAEDIATLDAYIGAEHSLGFPRLASLLEALERHFSAVSIVPAIGYPLAERCPTVICSV